MTPSPDLVDTLGPWLRNLFYLLAGIASAVVLWRHSRPLPTTQELRHEGATRYATKEELADAKAKLETKFERHNTFIQEIREQLAAQSNDLRRCIHDTETRITSQGESRAANIHERIGHSEEALNRLIGRVEEALKHIG